MENFYQVTLISKCPEEITPVVVLSSEQKYFLMKDVSGIEDCELFSLTICHLRNPNIKVRMPKKDERKVYVYYVVDGENYTGKFVGSYKEYSKLSENPLLVYNNYNINKKIRLKLEKKNLVSIDGSNFHKAVQVTYNQCYILCHYNNYILCEYRKIGTVANCDILVTYPGNRLGLNSWLFDFRSLINCGKMKFTLQISYRTFFDAIQCEKLSKNVISFYKGFLNTIKIPNECVDYIINDTCNGITDWKYRYCN